MDIDSPTPRDARGTGTGHAGTGVRSALQKLQQIDQARPSLPGEHWATFGLALALMRLAARGRSPLLRVTAFAAGAGLAWRAASGRDGLIQRLR